MDLIADSLIPKVDVKTLAKIDANFLQIHHLESD